MSKRIISILLIVFMILGFTIQNASAKRFGGGKSFGISRSISGFSHSSFQSPSYLSQNQPQNRWLGPLAGFALGGLVTSLFMGHGVSSGILSWVLIAILCLSLINIIRRFKSANMSTLNPYQSNASFYGMPNTNNMNATNSRTQNYPPDFEPSEFLREVKALFIRLQAAYDQKNLNDIRSFVAPAVFAEIQLQFQERGDQLNQTEVVSLSAVLVDFAMESTPMASVRFSGLIREENETIPFNEIWHFQKEVMTSKWLVAGIEQQP